VYLSVFCFCEFEFSISADSSVKWPAMCRVRHKMLHLIYGVGGLNASMTKVESLCASVVVCF